MLKKFFAWLDLDAQFTNFYVSLIWVILVYLLVLAFLTDRIADFVNLPGLIG